MTMRTTIGGPLDYRLMAQIHRPIEPEAIEREVRRLAAAGLKAIDISEALGISVIAIKTQLARNEVDAK